jgi:hypothetical protein
MAGLRITLAAILVGSGLFASSAVAQRGALVSLTHTVTVTVPPRVKVQVTDAPVLAGARMAGQPSPSGMSLSVTATQSWTLSIGTNTANSRLQWSRDGHSGYSAVTSQQAVVASGEISQIPASAEVFVRPAATTVLSRDAGGNDSSIVVLTMVAQ